VSYQPPAPPPPPPAPPEQPEAAPERPRWPAWFAPAAFVVVVGATTVLAGIVLAIAGKEPDDSDAVVTIIGTVIQAAVFIGTAVMFASFVDKPKPWQFGLRRTKFWPAVGWAALGLLAFYVFAALYTALAQPDVEQTVTKELGADQGTAGLIAAGVVVIVLAPLSEEFFFRGFFFRALRNRFPLLLAAGIDGLVFGFIHWDFSTAHGLLIVPPLAVLGFVFCLIYERTGSLFPVIALHAINNSAAYAAQVHDGWTVSVVAGPLMIAALILAPRALPRVAPAPG
jgi:membrane protease YdiL (CAAX protease family)